MKTTIPVSMVSPPTWRRLLATPRLVSQSTVAVTPPESRIYASSAPTKTLNNKMRVFPALVATSTTRSTEVIGASNRLSVPAVRRISASALRTAISNAIMTSFFQKTITMAMTGGMMETQSIRMNPCCFYVVILIGLFVQNCFVDQ